MMPMLQNVLTNLFGKPATRTFPATQREPFDLARGTVGFHIEKCNFCGLCAMRCPANAIEVKRAEKELFFEPFRCILCGLCEENCNKGCAYLAPASRAPVGDKPCERYKKPELPVETAAPAPVASAAGEGKATVPPAE